MVAEDVGMVNFSPIASGQGGQVLDYQKQLEQAEVLGRIGQRRSESRSSLNYQLQTVATPSTNKTLKPGDRNGNSR
jgi:hypothetical protein